MPTDLIEAAAFTGPISHPDPGDLASASQLRTGVSQTIADRTRFLFLDAAGARIADMANFTLGSGSKNIYGVSAGFDGTANGAVAWGDNALYTSATGETWTSRSFGGGYTGIVRGATKSNTRLVLCGGAQGANPQIQTSDDGTTWTGRTPGAGAPSDISFFDAAFGGGVFVLVGTTATTLEIQSSADGATWTRRTHALVGVRSKPSVVYHDSRFFISAVNSTTSIDILTSVDGTAWAASTGITDSIGSSCAPRLISNESRLAIAADNTIYRSDDLAASWQSTEISGGSWESNAAGFARGLFVMSGSRGGGLFEAFISDNGEDWFSVGLTPIEGTVPVAYRFVLGRWWVGIVSQFDRAFRSPRSVNL